MVVVEELKESGWESGEGGCADRAAPCRTAPERGRRPPFQGPP